MCFIVLLWYLIIIPGSSKGWWMLRVAAPFGLNHRCWTISSNSTSWWFQPPFVKKNACQIGSFPQISDSPGFRGKQKHTWNHHHLVKTINYINLSHSCRKIFQSHGRTWVILSKDRLQKSHQTTTKLPKSCKWRGKAPGLHLKSS